MSDRKRKITFEVPKGMFWTQTPEGKAHLSAIAKARHKAGSLGYDHAARAKRARRITAKKIKALPSTSPARSNGTAKAKPFRSPKAAMEAHGQEQELTSALTQARAQAIAYVYGRIESQLEVYATNLGIPFLELAAGISTLLRDKAHGALVGTAHRVPGVR